MHLDSDALRDCASALAVGVLLAGLARLVWRRRASGSRLVGPALAALVCGLAGLASEAALRLAGVPRAVGLALLGAPLDARLGWTGTHLDGDPSTTRPRLLVLGDSFTHGSGETLELYPRVASRLAGYEPWVRAAPGWGTLQEWLALEAAWEDARPDVIVLQVCSNDFINNDWELERGSFGNNNLSRRPYWEAGRAVMRDPVALLGLRRALAERSALAVWLNRRWRHAGLFLERRRLVGSTEQSVGREGLAFAPFARAVRTTEELVAHVRARADGRPLVLLPADPFVPFYDEWRKLAERQGLPLLTGGLDALAEAERRGARVRLSDGVHWNAAGHALVGRALAEWLRAQAVSVRADTR